MVRGTPVTVNEGVALSVIAARVTVHSSNLYRLDSNARSLVNAVKKSIIDASRGLVWKVMISMEVENLAIKQMLTKTAGSLATKGGLDIWEDEEADGAGEADDAEEGFQAEDLNVLDQILAMVFDRTLRQGDHSEEKHFQTMARKHLILKQLWIQDFGELPPDSLWR